MRNYEFGIELLFLTLCVAGGMLCPMLRKLLSLSLHLATAASVWLYLLLLLLMLFSLFSGRCYLIIGSIVAAMPLAWLLPSWLRNPWGIINIPCLLCFIVLSRYELLPTGYCHLTDLAQALHIPTDGVIGFDFLLADRLASFYHLPVAVFVAAWLVYRKKTAH